MRRTTASLLTAGLVLGGVFATTTPAVADEPIPLSDAATVVSAIAPGLIDSVAPSDVSRSATPAVPLSIDESEIRPTVSVGDESQQQTPLSITLLDAPASASAASGEFAVFADDLDNNAQYVQATPNGLRLLSATNTVASSQTVTYKLAFDSEGAVTALPEAGGGFLFVNAHGEAIGTISAPWALDANQRSLPTTFTYANGVLTQTIDTSSSATAYPVLADPNWTYSLTYTLGATTPNAVWNELHRCFNCNFPLAGAPSAFPGAGQVMPLTLGGLGNFSVKRNIAYNYTNPNVAPGLNSGFQLEAVAGHVDGAGSTIGFDYYKRFSDGKVVMTVNAFIKNDFVGGNTLYKSLAGDSWGQFAGNLIRNLGLPIPPQEPPTPPRG